MFGLFVGQSLKFSVGGDLNTLGGMVLVVPLAMMIYVRATPCLAEINLALFL